MFRTIDFYVDLYKWLRQRRDVALNRHRQTRTRPFDVRPGRVEPTAHAPSEHRPQTPTRPHRFHMPSAHRTTSTTRFGGTTKGRHALRSGHPSVTDTARGARGRHRRQRSHTLVTALTLLIATICSVPIGAAAAAAAPAVGSCTELDMPVTSGLLPLSMHGTLCTPPGAPADVPLEILVAGGTYSSVYWNGAGIAQYSYTLHANSAGFATLAVDRIGTGKSTHPLSILVNATMQTDILHQVIARAHAGTIDGNRYSRVALVGHSLGSMITVMEAAKYPEDVNAVVLTGYSHRISATQLLSTLNQMHPAALEGGTLDLGYLTTVPGAREGLFDNAADVDPAVVAADERTKDISSATELPDAVLAGLAPAVSRSISVPVLEADGGQDHWSCAAVDCANASTLLTAEQPDYSKPLTTYVRPQSGHALALARDGGEFDNFASTWLFRVLNADGTHAQP